jgi:hypothetical protein
MFVIVRPSQTLPYAGGASSSTPPLNGRDDGDDDDGASSAPSLSFSRIRSDSIFRAISRAIFISHACSRMPPDEPADMVDMRSADSERSSGDDDDDDDDGVCKCSAGRFGSASELLVAARDTFRDGDDDAGDDDDRAAKSRDALYAGGAEGRSSTTETWRDTGRDVGGVTMPWTREGRGVNRTLDGDRGISSTIGSSMIEGAEDGAMLGSGVVVSVALSDSVPLGSVL